MLDTKRLQQKLDRPRLHGLDDFFRLALSAHENYRGVSALRLQLALQFDARDPWHSDIEYQNHWKDVHRQRQESLRTVEAFDGVAHFLEQVRQIETDVRIVIHHEDVTQCRISHFNFAKTLEKSSWIF